MLLAPDAARVQIAQKTVKHTPIEKLYDAFISLLAGAHGLGEINSRPAPLIPAYKEHLDARPVRNNRWCSKPWMPARLPPWS